MEVVELRRQLEGEVTETRGVQAQLQATADEFRARHQQRRALVEQYDAAAASIRGCVHRAQMLFVQHQCAFRISSKGCVWPED